MSDEVKSEIIFDVKLSTEKVPYDKRKSFHENIHEEIVRRIRKVSPQRFEEMTHVYDQVCVNDYNDTYHMSDKEREKMSIYYGVFHRLVKCKRKYRKIDEFVNVFRLALDCLELVAENNGIYSPDKFKRMVLQGEIEVYGLNFPKYIGKDKKAINWNYISHFILDRELDPKELVSGHSDSLDELSKEDLIQRLFGEEKLKEFEDIMNAPEDPNIYSYNEDDENLEGVAFVTTKKEQKMLVKRSPEIIKGLRDVIQRDERTEKTRHKLHSMVFEMDADDYRQIAEMDRKRGYISESEIPKFKGNVTNRRDYMRYLLALDQYEDENVKENYNGKFRTLGEIKELRLKDALEKDGWNMRALYKSKEEEKLKKAYKKDRKREEELKKRLIKVQKRQKLRKKRVKAKIEFNVGKKRKKKKKIL